MPSSLNHCADRQGGRWRSEQHALQMQKAPQPKGPSHLCVHMLADTGGANSPRWPFKRAETHVLTACRKSLYLRQQLGDLLLHRPHVQLGLTWRAWGWLRGLLVGRIDLITCNLQSGAHDCGGSFACWLEARSSPACVRSARPV